MQRLVQGGGKRRSGMVASLDLCHSFDSLAELGVASRCEAAVIMDADVEDCPASVGCLLERLQSDAVDVVVAERRKRSEPWYFRMSYFFAGYFLLIDRREYPFWNFLCTLLVRSETFCFAAVGPPARLVGSFLVT